MTGSLTEAQIAEYREMGVAFPIRVMSHDDAACALRSLEDLEAQEGGTLTRSTNTKPHILLRWAHELVRHPGILDAVESIIGPNILCWGSGFFVKDSGDGTYVSWHQDSTYWGLSSPEVVTAWLSLTPSTPESGCLRVVPGTHRRDQAPHRDTFAQGNLLTRGQEISVDVDEKDAVDVVLQPGEISLHHVRIFHASEPNRSEHRRVGFAVRYIPTHVRQIGARTTALLVRGVDTFRHFDDEPLPAADFDAAAVAFHAEALNRIGQVLYVGTSGSSRQT